MLTLPLHALPVGIEEQAAVLGRERADDLEHVPDADGHRYRGRATHVYIRIHKASTVSNEWNKRSTGGTRSDSESPAGFVRPTSTYLSGGVQGKAARYGDDVRALLRLFARLRDVRVVNVSISAE